MERNKKYKKFGDRTSKGNEKKSLVHKKKLGGVAALMYEPPLIRVEAQLRSRSVTLDQTKFEYLVSSLSNTTAAEVKPVLLNPPAKDKYSALKAALLSAFRKSQTQKDAELCNISGLGDRTPSTLLRRLQSLNNDAETRRAFFLTQLPSQVWAILALQDFPNIHDLTKAADRIVEAQSTSQTGTAAAVRGPNSRALTGNFYKPTGNEKFICSYHQRFGPNARHCRPGSLLAILYPLRTDILVNEIRETE